MSLSGNAQIVNCRYAVGVDSIFMIDKGHRQGLWLETWGWFKASLDCGRGT